MPERKRDWNFAKVIEIHGESNVLSVAKRWKKC